MLNIMEMILMQEIFPFFNLNKRNQSKLDLKI